MALETKPAKDPAAEDKHELDPKRKAALDTALAQVEKSFGKGSAMRLGDQPEQNVEVIPTGSLALDMALGIGGLTIFQNGQSRVAAIAGGFVDVSREQTVVLARTCEWADEIDINRAREAAERARAILQKKESDHEHDIAQVKLKKAINRMRIAGDK